MWLYWLPRVSLPIKRVLCMIFRQSCSILAQKAIYDFPIQCNSTAQVNIYNEISLIDESLLPICHAINLNLTVPIIFNLLWYLVKLEIILHLSLRGDYLTAHVYLMQHTDLSYLSYSPVRVSLSWWEHYWLLMVVILYYI